MFLILIFLSFITLLLVSQTHYLLLPKSRDISDQDYTDPNDSENLLPHCFVMNILYSIFHVRVFPQKASGP